MSIHTERPISSSGVESLPVPAPANTHWTRALVRQAQKMCTTRTNAQLGLFSDTTVSLVLLYMGVRHGRLIVPIMLAVVGGGLLVFSFFEYAMHRWLFHGPAQVFQHGHLIHHQQPRGYDALPFFLPPLAMLVLASVLYLVIPTGAFLFAGSFAAGYAAYGSSHWIMHAVRFRSPLLRRWAADHHIHHFHEGTNFGVTSPLWDIVLRTRYVPIRTRARASPTANRR